MCAHTLAISHTDTVHIHFSGSLAPSVYVCLSLSTSLLSLSPPSTLGKPVQYSVSVNTQKCAHTAGRLCGIGAWLGYRARPTTKCSGAVMIGRYGSLGPCLWPIPIPVSASLSFIRPSLKKHALASILFIHPHLHSMIKGEMLIAQY